jgi:hypothetical protein
MIRITPIFYFIGRAELNKKIDFSRGAEALARNFQLMREIISLEKFR